MSLSKIILKIVDYFKEVELVCASKNTHTRAQKNIIVIIEKTLCALIVHQQIIEKNVYIERFS